MEKEIVKEYGTEELTVVWKPKLCIHAGECVKRLPKVYKPKAKPWITPDEATSSELKEQINACPSGALSFIEKYSSSANTPLASTNVKIIADGPMMVSGEISVEQSDGSTKTMQKAAFCRCGASGNKPFCDGNHKKVDFKG